MKRRQTMFIFEPEYHAVCTLMKTRVEVEKCASYQMRGMGAASKFSTNENMSQVTCVKSLDCGCEKLQELSLDPNLAGRTQ